MGRPFLTKYEFHTHVFTIQSKIEVHVFLFEGEEGDFLEKHGLCTVFCLAFAHARLTSVCVFV